MLSQIQKAKLNHDTYSYRACFLILHHYGKVLVKLYKKEKTTLLRLGNKQIFTKLCPLLSAWVPIG